MNLQIVKEKVEKFFTQFQTEKEFIEYCEVQGVKGLICASQHCLVAQAIKNATGIDSSVTVDGYIIVVDELAVDKEEVIIDLPEPLQRIPQAFDANEWPHLMQEIHRVILP